MKQIIMVSYASADLTHFICARLTGHYQAVSSRDRGIRFIPIPNRLSDLSQFLLCRCYSKCKKNKRYFLRLSGLNRLRTIECHFNHFTMLTHKPIFQFGYISKTIELMRGDLNSTLRRKSPLCSIHYISTQ